MTTRKTAAKTADVVTETAAAAAAAAQTGVVAETIESTVTAAQEVATKNIETTVAFTKENMDKMSQQAFQAYDDLTAFGKENVDAVMHSTTVVAKGIETISKSIMAFSQAQLEHSITAAKSLVGVKTLRELVDLHNDFARTSYDALVAEATKTTEMTAKVANEALEPITARFNATVEKFKGFKVAA